MAKLPAMMAIAELPSNRPKRMEADILVPTTPDMPTLMIDRSAGLNLLWSQANRATHEHGAIPQAGGDAAGLRCQAWGGPRASKSRWSIEAISTAAKDQDKAFKDGIGGTNAGVTGMTSVLAKLMLAQIAQKSSASPDGLLLCEDDVMLAEWSPAPIVTAQAFGAPPILPRWT
jgi:hypothetical protein